MQLLTEIVKSFIKEPEVTDLTSDVHPDNIIRDLDNDHVVGSFFDDNVYGGIFGTSDVGDILQKQQEKIKSYRQLAMNADVNDAIDEIVNEIIFSNNNDLPVKLIVNEENKNLANALNDKFDKVTKLLNLKRNFYQIVRQGYIDGVIILHCPYDTKNIKAGLSSIKIIEPCMLYFDARSRTYKYLSDDRNGHTRRSDNYIVEYSVEEIVREDFGLYDGKINLGYLEHAIKPANMLKTLEDLLIPLRFSRSISRRVFNVDIGDLPAKRGAEVMREHQNKFKYKKFYNNETGEVSNQQHITSMVEDYWFANRSGGKGTQVDVLDETGNLGELDDIIYFARKLYRALKIPSNRVSVDPNRDMEFDYDTTRTSKEDMKFFMFISRLRLVYSSLLKEVLKREVISTGVMSEDEWNDKEDMISVVFESENAFIEKMHLNNLTSKLDIYTSAQEHQGKLFSVQKLLKDVFKMSEEEIEEELKLIKKEESNPLYKKFYNAEDGW